MSSIKRTGFCYQVAYGFVPKNERPERVNICEFPWDFFVGILRLCFGGIVMVLGLTLTYLCGTLWGHRLKMIKTGNGWADKDFTSEQFSWLPTVKRFVVRPLYVILAPLTVWFIYQIFMFFATISASVYIGMALIIFSAVAALFIGRLIADLILRGPRTKEFRELVSLWWRAGREKWCPVLEVVDS